MEISSIIEKLELMGNEALAKLDSLCIDAPISNKELLFKIINDNKHTEFGKKHHFDEIKTEEDYRSLVPITEFEDYAEYTERMKNGEKNVLSCYPLALYSHSSGSTGVPKSIPTSQMSIDIFSKYMLPRFFALCKNAGRPITGKGLCCIEVVDKVENGNLYSNISGAGIREIDDYISKLNVLPYEVTHPKGFMPVLYLKLRYALEERDLSFISGIFMAYFADMMDYLEHHWQMFTDDIRFGKCDYEGFTFAPNPSRADELEAEFKKGFDTPIMPRIWKKLSALSAVGTGGFAEYTSRMRRYLGDIPVDFLAYAASEALMGCSAKLEQEAYTLLLGSCYYEFLEKDSGENVDFDKLEIGKKYEIIITNLSGFYRYRLNDIVKVMGYNGSCPTINFCYRKNQLLDIVGDKITSEMLSSIMAQFKNKTNVDVTDFEVYVNRSISPSRYEFLIETSPTFSPNKTSEYARILDECICDINQVYCECRKTDEIAPVVVYLQEKNAQKAWITFKNNGDTNIQQKPVRLLNNQQKKDFFYSRIIKPEYVIRKLKNSEINDALTLAWEVFTQYESPVYSKEGTDEFYKSIHDADYLAGIEYFGTFDNGKLIGIVAIRPERQHICFFFVKGEYHRQGIGRAMFNKILAEFPKGDITLNASPYGLEFYRKLEIMPVDDEQTVNGIRFTPMRYKR